MLNVAQTCCTNRSEQLWPTLHHHPKKLPTKVSFDHSCLCGRTTQLAEFEKKCFIYWNIHISLPGANTQYQLGGWWQPLFVFFFYLIFLLFAFILYDRITLDSLSPAIFPCHIGDWLALFFNTILCPEYRPYIREKGVRKWKCSLLLALKHNARTLWWETILFANSFVSMK